MTSRSYRNSANKNIRLLCALLLSVPLLFASACGGGGSNTGGGTPPSNNPVPTVASLSPSSLTAGAAAQTLTISGTGFLSSSTVTFNGAAHAAADVSASELTISLTTADLATAGSYPVVVTNPAPGGGASAPASFTVSATNPVPTVASLSPSSLTAGATAQTLTINGTGFLSASTVTFNSVAHAATYVSASQLTISLTTADLATAGSYPVVVTNPAPGGGSSAAVNFAVTAASTITGVSVVCSPTSIQTNQTSTCVQTVTGTGSFSNYVNWSVSPTGLGSINTSGVFTPASTGTATVKATSTQDSTKSGSATVTVTAQSNVSIAPTSAQVQVFHSQQFSAAVNGSSSAAATWAVNGIPGGNLTVGQIDSTGFYLAPNALPSPSGVTITATSQADATQSASASVTVLPDATPPAIVSATPAADQSGVALDSPIQIQFSDTLDPSTVNTSTFTIGSGSTTLISSVSYNSTSNTVTLTHAGVFAPGTQYIVTVSNLVANPAGTPLAAAYQWLFTTQPVSIVNGMVSAPSGTAPPTLTVVSYGGQESTPDSQGNFTASLTPAGTNLVAAMVAGKSFGWLTFAGDQSQGANAAAAQRLRSTLAAHALVPGRPGVHVTRYQVTASPLAASDSDSIAVDSQTTAEALLFISPYLYHSDPDRSAAIRAAIAADPNTAILATALESASNDSDPLANAGVQSAQVVAIKSVLATLAASTSQQATSQSASLQIESSSENLALALATTANTSLLATQNLCNSTSGSDNLPCLDLDYISATASSDPSLQNRYAITVDNSSCATQHSLLKYLGCSADWIILAAPVTHTPSGGVVSIVSGMGSNGPDSPEGILSDCSITNYSACTRIFYLEGKSNFSELDPINDLGSYLSKIVGSDLGESPNSFDLPSDQPGDYVIRAYSGGWGLDSVEWGNVWGVDYDAGRTMWTAALVGNVLHSTIEGLEAAKIVPSTVEPCVLDGISTGAAALESSFNIASSGFSSQSAFEADFTLTANQLIDEIPGVVDACAVGVASDSSGGFWKSALDVVKNGISWATDTVDVLGSVASGGEAVQRLAELVGTATPVETAIIHVSQNTGTLVISGLSSSSLTGFDGNQSLTILGSGFASGAKVYWQLANGTTEGSSIPTSFSTNALTVSKNFGNLTASWKVQVINPNGTPSNWWTFQVTAQSSGISAPALSLPSNGATGVSTSPTFTWSSVSGAKSYWLTVALNAATLPANISTSSCPSCAISISVTTNSYSAPTGKLSVGQKYYWQVQGYDNSVTPSLLGQYSGQWSFTTQSPGQSALSITTTSFSPSTATVGTAYGAQQAIAATGGTIPYIWSVSGQPSGMAMNATTGALYGAPTVSGTFNITVIVKDSSSPQQTASTVLPLTVAGSLSALWITSTGFSPSIATVGTAYGAQQAIAATGGTTPYIWSVSGQPSGMSMNATSGALYGTPTASGTFNSTVTVKDSSSPQQTASKVLTLSVSASSQAISITSTGFSPSIATVGTGYSAQQAMAAAGGTLPYIWSISGQPNGMSMNATTGALYGTPTVSGTFDVAVTVKDSSSPQQIASKVLTLTVAASAQAISITSNGFSPPTATVGTAYGAQQAMAATGGTGSYTWSISGQPNGMSMNATSGALFGTPTASGTFNITVTVKDSGSPQQTASKVLTLTVQ